MQKSTGKWYLSFKRTKLRGKPDPLALDYFNHPFVNNNGIRLEPDVTKPEPVSIISLASDLVSIDDRPDAITGSARKRPNVSNAKARNSVENMNVDIEALLKAS